MQYKFNWVYNLLPVGGEFVSQNAYTTGLHGELDVLLVREQRSTNRIDQWQVTHQSRPLNRCTWIFVRDNYSLACAPNITVPKETKKRGSVIIYYGLFHHSGEIGDVHDLYNL